MCALLLTACHGEQQPGSSQTVTVVRLGHFPNVTHAHGLVAHALSRRGDGIFEKHLGKDIQVEWFTYNAGPTAMEAMMTGSLDVTYVGPSPAINAFTRTTGGTVRVLAGATLGGDALVVRDASSIKTAADLRGKRVATPQFGNTQDVGCRAWLAGQGFKITQTGGDVQVVPTANPDQLALFQSGELDAAWTVEPWVSRLETEGGGRILVEAADAVTTVLAGRAEFVAQHPDLVTKLRAAHHELTLWILAHPSEAQELVRAELAELTGRPVSKELIERCWPRLRFTEELRIEWLQDFVAKAHAAGFIPEPSDITNLVAPR